MKESKDKHKNTHKGKPHPITQDHSTQLETLGKGRFKCPEQKPKVNMKIESNTTKQHTQPKPVNLNLNQRTIERPNRDQTKTRIERQPGRTPATKRKRNKNHTRTEHMASTETEQNARMQDKNRKREQPQAVQTKKPNPDTRKPKGEEKTARNIIQYLMESRQVAQGTPPREKLTCKTNPSIGKVIKSKKGKATRGRSKPRTQGQVDRQIPIYSILKYFSSNVTTDLECEQATKRNILL